MNVDEEYSTADGISQSEYYTMTIVCIGKTGVAVANALYNLCVKDILVVICDTDLDVLRASVVPNKILVPTEEQDEFPKKEWPINVISPYSSSSSCTLVLVVADLEESISCRLVPPFLEAATEAGHFSIALLVRPTEPESQKQADHVLHTIQNKTRSVMLVERHQIEYERQIFQLTDAVSALVEICLPSGKYKNPKDISDSQQCMSLFGRIAALSSTGSGSGRSMKAVEEAFAVLKRQPFDIRLTKRAILIITTSPDYPLMQPEQMAVVKAITERMGEEPQIFLFGTIRDSWLGDEFKLNLLLWQPIN